MDETTPVRPPTPYGAAKLACEVLADHYGERYGVDVIGVRPTFTYESGRYTGVSGMFNTAVRDLAPGGRARFDAPFGLQTQLVPIYVKDMVRAFVAALQADRPKHRLFNGGTNEVVTMADVLASIGQVQFRL